MYNSDSLFSGLSPGRSEPMNLGASSPGGSPTSPMTAGQYLPSFLIGASASSTPFVWPGSPNKNHQRSFTVSPPSPMQQNLLQPTIPASQTQRGYVGRLAGDKPSGPPVSGLVESIHSPAVFNKHSLNDGPMESFSPSTPLSSLSKPGTTSIRSQSLFGASKHVTMSPAQLDPFYTQRESLLLDEQLDETWVTVFGFPAAATSYILQQFSQYGTIVEHKLVPNGNWVHLHYQSKLQAKKAISKNGKVLGSIMIGVKPCIEKSIMDEAMKENSPDLTCSPVRSPSSPWSEDLRRESESEQRSVGNMRPLTQAYRVSASERDVSSTQRTPQKNNNVFSRTMDYMFGW